MKVLVSSARFVVFAVLSGLVFASTLGTGSASARDAFESVLTGFSQPRTKGAFELKMNFAGTPRSKLIVLADPNRVVVDFYDTVTAVKDLRIEPNDLVGHLRHGLVSQDRFRLVFELKHPGIPDLAMTSVDGKSTLTLRIAGSQTKAFLAAASNRAPAAPQQQTASMEGEAAKSGFTVVIDPGHGGVDTGATGKHGTLEKDVNLKFALALRDVLTKDPNVRVLMTREDDTFVSLSERSEIARRAKANLFVSMHSDSIRYADLRGASVYTLSEKASDSLAHELADSENAADRFIDAGGTKGKPEVFDILVEFMRRETGSLSEHFAAGLVRELGRHDIRLIRNPKRSAGFKVLTAPDVPSVLLEIGYLSNADDEQLLLDESWRADSANAIASAITQFLGTSSAEKAPDRR